MVRAMSRRVCALLLGASLSGVVVAACGTVESDNDPDGRPLELEYIVGAIFAPSCGQTQCHSKFKQAGGLVFDSPDDARASLLAPASGPLLRFDSEQDDRVRLDGIKPNLLVWLTEIDPFGQGTGRMPFDGPLPQQDLNLLSAWIREPTPERPGASAKGAQCNPALYDGFACNFDERVRCTEDYNFGEPEETCPGGCQVGTLCADASIPLEQCPANMILNDTLRCAQ